MANFNDLVSKFLQQRDAIVNKGGTVNVAHTNPSPDELLAGINSIQINRPQITASNGYAIIAAERPNTTLKLFNSSNTLLSTQTTNSTLGGYKTFTVSTIGSYTIKAYDSSNNELWSNTISISETGVYNCKSGLTLDDYTWAEINVAAKNYYAKYMFNLWDSKKIPSFMGSTNANYTTAYIVGFDHDNKVCGGKSGITFMIPTTSSTYKHWNTGSTNDNGISWIGSLIRRNCLKNGDSYYTYDKSVDASTSGTYYVYNEITYDFVAQTLPANYIEGAKYYTKTTLDADGSFIAGMTSEMLDYIVQVEKKTWGGWGGSINSSTNANADQTVITTKDYLFIPADCEVFGKDNRFYIGTSAYSHFDLEGEQYEGFKEYRENRFRFSGNSRWFRSPCVYNSSGIAAWSNTGYSGNGGANGATYLPLCFCF